MAEAAAQQGFWPNLISTDLHSGNVHGAAKDLCYVMTKLFALGMPLHKVSTALKKMAVFEIISFIFKGF